MFQKKLGQKSIHFYSTVTVKLVHEISLSSICATVYFIYMLINYYVLKMCSLVYKKKGGKKVFFRFDCVYQFLLLATMLFMCSHLSYCELEIEN